MQEYVGEMVPAGVEAVQIDAQHVGKPGEGKPVRRVACSKRPGDGRRREALPDVDVVDHEIRVIETDESEIPHLEVDGEDGNRQHERDPPVDSAGDLLRWSSSPGGKPLRWIAPAWPQCRRSAWLLSPRRVRRISRRSGCHKSARWRPGGRGSPPRRETAPNPLRWRRTGRHN